MYHLSDNYADAELGKFPNAELVEKIDGTNYYGQEITAWVYRFSVPENVADFYADGNEQVGLSGEEPVIYTVQTVSKGEEPKGEMPLEFGEKGLAGLRKFLAR